MDYSKYYTPISIAQLLVEYLQISAPAKIVDICCGSCNLLMAAKRRWRNAILYGSDIAEQSTDDVIFEKIDGREYALNHKKEFSLVLANPPFDYLEKKNEYPQLFQAPFENYSSFRLEVEMLISNLIMLKDGGTLLIIMPSSFVEGEVYSTIRQILSKNYQIKAIIELDKNTFGSSQLHSHAIIIKNKLCKNYTCNLLCAKKHGEIFDLEFVKTVSAHYLRKGRWDGSAHENCNLLLDIKRGNISSADFIKVGQPVLHTSKYDDNWYPAMRYVENGILSNAYAETGDIIVSRIGKSAGQWCLYSGPRIPISDCLYRIKDPDGTLYKKIKGKSFDRKLRGVATPYITISDFKNWINSISKAE